MLKQFFRDSAIYGLAGILSRGISLLLVPVFTRVLLPGDYGIVDLLTIVASLVYLTIALEISQAVPRFWGDASTEEGKVGYASTGLWFTVTVYTAFCVAAALAAPQLGRWVLRAEGQESIVLAAIAMMYVTGIFYYVQNQLRWQLRPREYAVASLAMTIATLLAAVVLVPGMRLRALGVFAAQAVGATIGLVIGLYFLRDTFRPVFHRDKCGEMLRFSLPLVPSGIAVFVALYSDRIIIQQLMTLTDVGLFGIGYRFASIVSLLMVGFQGAMMPLVYTHHRDPGTPAQLARIFRAFCAFALLLCASLALLAPELLILFTTPAYYGAAGVIPLLAPAVLFANMYIFAPGLAIAKRTRVIALLTTSGAVLNVAGNLLLVPRLGIFGAALATLLSALIVFVLWMMASQRSFHVPHDWMRLGLAAAGTLALCALGVASWQLPLALGLAIPLKLIALAALAGFLVAVGLVRRQEIASAISTVRGMVARVAPGRSLESVSGP